MKSFLFFCLTLLAVLTAPLVASGFSWSLGVPLFLAGQVFWWGSCVFEDRFRRGRQAVAGNSAAVRYGLLALALLAAIAFLPRLASRLRGETAPPWIELGELTERLAGRGGMAVMIGLLISIPVDATADSHKRPAARTGWVTAHSYYGHPSLTRPVRRGAHGLEVDLGNNTWAHCAAGDCRETLRREKIDFAPRQGDRLADGRNVRNLLTPPN